MKTGWQTRRISDFCEVIAGQSPEGKFYNAEGKGMPFYQGKKDFGEKFIDAPTTWTTHSTKVAQEGDILISVRAPVGPVNFATEKVCIGRGLAAIRSGADLYRDFLFYQLLHLQPVISGKQGAVFASINKSEIEALPLAFAPLREQQRIVGILDEAFDGIATAKVNAEKNLRNARAIFESHVNAVFTQEAEAWAQRRLGDVADTQYGLSESMNEEGKGYKIFRMGEVQEGRLIDTGRMKYADISQEEFQKYKLRLGDVLFNRTNSFALVGKTGIFEVEGDYCFASYLVRLVLKPSVMIPAFLNYFMNSELFQVSVKAKASRSINQANINATILSNESVRFPESLQEQRSIVDRLASLRAETQRLESIYQRKLAALDALKKSLLNEAFTGQL